MDYNRYFNKISIARKYSPLREMGTLIGSRPNAINMAGGIPDPETFPIRDATFSLSDGSELNMDQESMKVALQYSYTKGMPALIKWIYDLQKRVHNPPLMGNKEHPGQTTCIITNGSQDGLCKTIEALVSEGDNVLVENPVYPGFKAAIGPHGCNLLPIESDGMGINPDRLRQVLSRWNPEDAMDFKSDIPKILYCVPTGGNPTGAGLTLDRKKEIYRLAQEYNLILLEDDPYFYLQFQKPPVPSFLSLDTDGRVVRFDSLSKVFSAGMRVGFATGPQPVIEKIEFHLSCSSMHASALPQMILKNIFHHWSHDRFLLNTNKISDHYREKCNQCVKAMEKHLSGLAEWRVPSGGMFVWLKLLNVTDSYDLMVNKMYPKDVIFVPGAIFEIDKSKPSPYIRVSYCCASPEQMDMAFSTLAEVLKQNCKEEL